MAGRFCGFASERDGAVTDYGDPADWLSRPAWPAHEAATFYLYPTSHFGDDPIAAADSATMREQARQVFAVQGRAFASTDVYAPYYRQLSLARLLGMLDDPAAIAAAIAAAPLADARAAFEVFLREAGERPVILAAHSQGSIAMQALVLWIRQAHPELFDRLVAAYLVGVPVSEEFLAAAGLPFAAARADTGVVVAWSTEAPGTAFNPFVSSPPGLAINPVTWTRDETPASREQSLGGLVRFSFDEPATPSPRFADARIDTARGTVVTTANIQAKPPWPYGVLHRWDYDLFLCDVEQNVRDRVAACLARRGRAPQPTLPSFRNQAGREDGGPSARVPARPA